jgi:hypothetical protein
MAFLRTPVSARNDEWKKRQKGKVAEARRDFEGSCVRNHLGCLETGWSSSGGRGDGQSGVSPCFVSAIVVIGIVAACPAATAGSRPLSGIIVGGVSGNPFWVLSVDDPLLTLDAYPIPSDRSVQEKRKLDRVYYPRTREALLDYDLMVFHAARIQHFVARQIHDLDYAFREAKMAAFCGLTGLGIGWEDPVLLEVIPIYSRSVSPYSRSYRVKFRRDRDPVFTSFLEYGVENVFGNVYTEMYVKPGAKVWGDIVPYDLPWLISWRPGGGDPGMLWTVAHIFDGWWDERNNPYALDVATNMIFHSLEMELIVDIPARRAARLMFRNVRVQLSLIVSMLSWADSFGAKTASLEERLIGLEGEAEKAVDDYISQDYAPAISFLESLMEEVEQVTAEAVRIKNDALLWVYAIEWLAVSGTGAVCGFVLWTLMIRRRSFREVATTRLTIRDTV